MDPCGYRQYAPPLRHLAGPPVPSFWCRLKKCAVIEMAHPFLEPIGCDQCTDGKAAAMIDPMERIEGWLTCGKRGRPTGETVGCQCSIDRRIFECSHQGNASGKCLKRLPSSAKPECLGKVMDGVAVCAGCQLWNTENET